MMMIMMTMMIKHDDGDDDDDYTWWWCWVMTSRTFTIHYLFPQSTYPELQDSSKGWNNYRRLIIILMMMMIMMMIMVEWEDSVIWATGFWRYCSDGIIRYITPSNSSHQVIHHSGTYIISVVSISLRFYADDPMSIE
jgi:phosphatidylglycerophosphate synthase